MTIRLRPHHLLCVLTYAGKGYTPAFVGNFDRIAARIAGGESLQVVAGPDDVCAGWLDSPEAHCRNASINMRDAAAAAALVPLLGPLSAGAEFLLSPARIAALRDAFRAGTIRDACTACEWSELCTGIAADGFQGTRLPGICGQQPRR